MSVPTPNDASTRTWGPFTTYLDHNKLKIPCQNQFHHKKPPPNLLTLIAPPWNTTTFWLYTPTVGNVLGPCQIPVSIHLWWGNIWGRCLNAVAYTCGWQMSKEPAQMRIAHTCSGQMSCLWHVLKHSPGWLHLLLRDVNHTFLSLVDFQFLRNSQKAHFSPFAIMSLSP